MKTKLWMVLALIIILIISCYAEADTIVASGTHGSNLAWMLDSNGTLTISGEGEMADFNSSGTYDWRNSSIVSRTTSIIIEDGVTSIGSYAFQSFENLVSVTIANSVTLLGERAFAMCTHLTTVQMSTSIQSIGNWCFSECRALTGVNLSSSLRTIGKFAFNVCHQLAHADLPEGLVTIGENAFDSCDKLASVVIPSTVTTIGNYAFDGCHAIKEITIPSTITSMGSYVFSNCSEMETAIVEEGITVLPNSTFNNCYKLGMVSLPSTLTSIGAYTFNTGYYGTSYPMTSIVIPDNVTEIGNYAFNCQTSLTIVTLPAELKTIGQQAFGRCLALTEIVIPTGTESIGSNAFTGSTNLEKITIPRSVTSIGVSAFGDCPNVTIYCYADSVAHTYALENELSFALLEEEQGVGGLEAPSNIHWVGGSTATASWDVVEEANYYQVDVFVFCDNTEIGHVQTGTTSCELDVQQEINLIINGDERYQIVQVDFSVTSVLKTAGEEDVQSVESTRSPQITYSFERIKLAKPQNVVLSDDLVVTWTPVEHADGYSIGFTLFGEEGSTNTGTYAEEQIDENGLAFYDCYQTLNSLYYSWSYTKPMKARVTVSASVSSEHQNQFAASDSTDSNDVVFTSRKPVEALTLSPRAPLLYQGHSMYLGKTITPEDAYYTSINWSSSDESIVSVSDAGGISGINVGTTNITAAIGQAIDTVPVTVYTISSNIENTDTLQEVTDTAGTIIDDLGNNEEPDIIGTDIDQDRIDDLHEQIHEGIERGDEFHTDWWWRWRGWDYYTMWWNEILQFLANGQYACAYDVGFEMYHKDTNGNHHTIGNITEFDREIEFAFNMPELPALEYGKHREFTLVRIHNNQVEAIPVTFGSDDKFYVKSDRFSDFVLMYEDMAAVPTPTLTLLPDYEQNVYLGMPVYYSGLGSDGDLPYGGLDGLWSEVKNYNDMKAYYGNEPEWSYTIPQNAPFTVTETASWENSFNLWLSFDMPASPIDVPVNITCEWGGQIATTTVTLHYVHLPNGIVPTDHDGPTEVHLKVGDTLVITGDAVNGGWNSDNTIFTMPLAPTPSGWGIPNWPNHVVLFDEQMEAFAEADPNNRRQSSKTFTVTKAGTFIATVMLSADTVYMGHNVVFYVEKDGVIPPPVLDISGPDVTYFVGEGLVLSDTSVLNKPYTGSFLLNRIMSDDAGYAAILSGNPVYTAVCDDPDIQFHCTRDGRWCELYLDALPNATQTVTFTITCDWDGAHGETEAKVNFVKIPMPTGLFREADHQAPPTSLTVKTYDRLTAIDMLHLANDYVVDDDDNYIYYERGMWYNEGDENAEDPFSVFVNQDTDFFRIAGKPGTYDITLSSSSANITWTQECHLVIENRPILALPASITEIESQAFAGTAVEVVIIPTGCQSIDHDAFDGCQSLTCIINRSNAVVNVPNGVTVIKE